jgi:hypothetical protein
MRRIVLALCLLPAATGRAQSPGTSRCQPTLAPRGAPPQVADTVFDAAIPDPAFPAGRGPLVLLDEAHHNFHTLTGRYAPFARLLRRDGFVVAPLRVRVTADALARARVFVIANALADRNAGGVWNLPVPPAFTPEEVRSLEHWVAGGGSLLVIADHMPFPGAAETVAAAFGMMFLNGFATDSLCGADEFVFRIADGTLADHPITSGRSERERVDSVRSFTGSALLVLAPGRPLMLLEPGAVVLMPATAWQFSDSTVRLPGEGLAQGAVLPYGRGRVAVFGEAAMFSAQVSGPQRRPMGMNAPRAGQNPQFLLNVMHWLAGLLPRE